MKKVANIRHPGNQPLTNEEVDLIFRQLVPHLKAGYSIRKACEIAQIPKSTIYDIMQRDTTFADKINIAREFLGELASSVIASELITIKSKQNEGVELSKSDLSFVQWFATSHYSMREFFGQKVEKTLDPELEIKRIISIIDAKANES